VRVDSHQHFWEYGPAEYAWIGDGMDVLKRDFLPADLAPEIAAAGVDATVLVQARQSLAETRWQLEVAEATPWVAGTVGWVPLSEPGVGEVLAELAPHRFLNGVRHVVQDEPDPGFMLRADFNRGVAQLARHGLVYDVLIYQRHLPQAAEFIDRHPDQPFVVDHLAKPEVRNGQLDPEWRRGLAALAGRPNVVAVKLSGLVTEVRDPDPDPDTLRRYLDTAAGLFGTARLMFGSDWPVCLLRAPEYGWWHDLVSDFASAFSTEEQDAVFGGNAARVYGLAGALRGSQP
jgi:L-fuconolactonase